MLCVLRPGIKGARYGVMFGELLLRDELALFHGLRNEYDAKGAAAGQTHIVLRLLMLGSRSLCIEKDSLRLFGFMDAIEKDVLDDILKAAAGTSLLWDWEKHKTLQTEWCVDWKRDIPRAALPSFLRIKTMKLWQGCGRKTFPAHGVRHGWSDD